jgi:hypothetical protein
MATIEKTKAKRRKLKQKISKISRELKSNEKVLEEEEKNYIILNNILQKPDSDDSDGDS